jgi:nitrogen fixation/metabolism regulation signal transduction histidine kinase
MSMLGILNLVLCIFLAIVIGLYVGNLLKNRRREKGSKQKRFTNKQE